jgi:hypothetical protein
MKTHKTFLRREYNRIATARSSAVENTGATQHIRVSDRTATARLESGKMLNANEHRRASHRIATENGRREPRD